MMNIWSIIRIYALCSLFDLPSYDYGTVQKRYAKYNTFAVVLIENPTHGNIIDRKPQLLDCFEGKKGKILLFPSHLYFF